VADRIPQQHKDKIQEKYERGKHFLTEEYFPEERRDQFIFRVKKVAHLIVNPFPWLIERVQVIIECQKHDDYQESLRWLLGYVEEYAKHGKTVAEHGKDHHEQVTSVEFF
jgi:Family of unknown function (DUF5923)